MITIFTTGGTIDKKYFDKKSEYQVGEPVIKEILYPANVSAEYEIESILKKDSLDFTSADRELIVEKIVSSKSDRIIITHGTDTIIKTAKTILEHVPYKIVVLTGSMDPAVISNSDAKFNIGAAFIAVQTLRRGVYIVINGRVFTPDTAVKNTQLNRFEVNIKCSF